MSTSTSPSPSTSNVEIDLFKGFPSPHLLPPALLQTAAQAVLSDPTISTPSLLYGPDKGISSLRAHLSSWLSPYYNTPWTDPSRITITGGASTGLGSILQVFTDPSYTKNVYMVAPTYFLACRIFEDHGFAGRLRAVPEDEEGIDLVCLEAMLSQDELENGWYDERPTKIPLSTQKHYKNIIYAVPTFSNPSGKTMSLRRRKQLVRLARAYDALIITDDVYDFLHWDASKPGKATMPRVVDIDHTLDGGVVSPFGNVVSNGSFSKILGPGLRTGWTESTPLFGKGLSQCGATRSGGAPSQFAASIIAETLRTGALQRRLKDVLIPAYSHRCRVALDAVEKYLIPHGVILDTSKYTSSKTSQKHPQIKGGYYIYVHLPSSVYVTAFANRAEKEEKVIIGSGENFQVSGDEESVPIKHSLRICFAWEDEDLLVEGIKKLGRVLERVLAGVNGLEKVEC